MLMACPSLGDTVVLDWELGALVHLYPEWNLSLTELVVTGERGSRSYLKYH